MESSRRDLALHLASKEAYSPSEADLHFDESKAEFLFGDAGKYNFMFDRISDAVMAGDITELGTLLANLMLIAFNSGIDYQTSIDRTVEG